MDKRQVLRLWVGAMVLVASFSAQAGEETKRFWELFGDSRAEVNSYELVQPRYGELRQGTAVLIYVAEPFLRSTRVKPEPDRGHAKEDQFYVLKLNELRSFVTGIYPYRTMTSSFVHVDPEGSRPRGSPTKVAFSSQEWCGVTFHELLFEPAAVLSKWFSYFDGEAHQEVRLGYPDGGLAGDTVFVAARGLLGELLPPGTCKTLPWLPSLFETRLLHKPLAWAEVKVTRGGQPSSLEVPAGSFEVDTLRFEVEGRSALTVQVESAWPHRIIAWSTDAGEQGRMMASQRVKYWEKTSLADESLRRTLHLP